MTDDASLIKNKEALENPIYNPDYEDEVTQLYMLMQPANESDDEVHLQEYIDMFLEFPTTSVYNGVLINPRQCEIDDIRNLFVELETDINTLYNVTNQIPAERTYWDNNYQTEIGDDIQEALDSLNELEDHTNRITFNMPSLMSLAQGAAGIATVTSALSNPCLGLNNFFDSLMSTGKQLLSSLKSALSSVVSSVKSFLTSLINPITGLMNAFSGMVSSFINGIKSMVDGLKNAANAIKDQIMNEIKNFAKALLGSLRLGLADFLKGLRGDPCLKSLLKTVLSGAALGALKLI